MTSMQHEIDTLIHTQIAANEPGVAVAVVKDRQVVICQGYGLANLEWEQAIMPHTVFGLGSITKPFTATAIMLLEKQGKLHLDNPIQMYLPEYPTHGHHVTLTHLLTHTSGIPNFVTHPGFWEKHAHIEKSVDGVIALFKDLPFDFKPGSRYSYSNSGYVLLGHILERLLDKSYADVIQHLIFDPLGMAHSFYLCPEPIIPYRASGYTHTEEEYQHAHVTTPAVKHAAGGLGSTLEDMLLWDTALREERLLDHATQERMYAPVQLADGHTENYGFGWAIGKYRKHYVIHHAGGIPGFSAFFGFFPDDEVTIILLSNRHDLDCAGLARKISHLMLDLPAPVRTSVALDSELFSKMVGTYSSVFGTTEVIAEGKVLYIQQWGKHALVPMDEASFYWAEDEDVEVQFENPNEQGVYRRIRVSWSFFWLTAERVKG